MYIYSIRTFSIKSATKKKTRVKPPQWEDIARPSQRVPAGDWRTWLIMAGRGFGKTRTGAETIRQWVKSGKCKRIAILGDTEHDVREVMIRGHGGLLSVHDNDRERPTFSGKSLKITWPCGAVALAYSARSYERLRGPQFDGAWVDELAKFPKAQEAWDQLMFCLRLGNPQVIVTTTPRPIGILKELEASPHTVLTRGSTYENAANLPPAYMEQIIKRYEGTRLGAQEIMGHVLHDDTGFLWQQCYIQYGCEDGDNGS